MNMDWQSIYFYLTDSLTLLLAYHFFMKLLTGTSARLADYLRFLLLPSLIIFFVQSVLWQFILITGLLSVAGIGLYRNKVRHVVLYAILIMTVMQLCFGISNSLLSIIMPFLYLHNAKEIILFMIVIGSLLALIPMYFCFHMMDKYFMIAPEEQNAFVLMILTPLFMIFGTSAYLNYTVYGNTVVLDQYSATLSFHHLQTLGIQSFGILSLFCILSAYQKLLYSFHLASAFSSLQQETQFQRQYVAEAQARYEKTKAFRHDLNNHFSVLRGLLEKNQLVQAKQYMEKLESITVDLSFPCQTNNPVIDIVAGNKLGLAVQLGISVDCFINIPNPCTIENIDFCIILANALDNAICACQKLNHSTDKYIHLSGRRQGDYFLIEIENSSDKELSYNIGTGLSNIKAVTEKYNGTMEITCQSNLFCLSILLIIPQHKTNISQQMHCSLSQKA